ncbi:Copper-Transporting Atpase 1 [Manis pentadactyla]|nr:Copper-Transporting Atpase 1 [Manis pentadactyla]
MMRADNMTLEAFVSDQLVTSEQIDHRKNTNLTSLELFKSQYLAVMLPDFAEKQPQYVEKQQAPAAKILCFPILILK